MICSAVYVFRAIPRSFQAQNSRFSNSQNGPLFPGQATGTPRGEVRVTCSTTLGERFVAPILRDVAQRFPELSISIELTNRVVDLVADGFDLAVRTGELTDARLVGHVIATRRFRTVAAPEYLARAGTPETIEHLGSHECLMGSSSVWHFEVDGKTYSHRPSGRWHCNNGAVVVEAAIAGMGICQVPEFYVGDLLSVGALVSLLDRFQSADEPIRAVYPGRRHLEPKVRVLVDELRRQLGPAMAQPAPHGFG